MLNFFGFSFLAFFLGSLWVLTMMFFGFRVVVVVVGLAGLAGLGGSLNTGVCVKSVNPLKSVLEFCILRHISHFNFF